MQHSRQCHLAVQIIFALLSLQRTARQQHLHEHAMPPVNGNVICTLRSSQHRPRWWQTRLCHVHLRNLDLAGVQDIPTLYMEDPFPEACLHFAGPQARGR